MKKTDRQTDRQTNRGKMGCVKEGLDKHFTIQPNDLPHTISARQNCMIVANESLQVKVALLIEVNVHVVTWNLSVVDDKCLWCH